jgi:predicted nucleotidyltransferase
MRKKKIQIDVSTLRRDLFNALSRVTTDGPIEILRNGKVVATLGPPPAEFLVDKPTVNQRRLARICKKHHIRRLALFGSMLRDDFGSDSDVDLLYDPARGHIRTIGERMAAADDLSRLFGRKVDFVKRSVVEESTNDILRRSILDNAQVIYEG